MQTASWTHAVAAGITLFLFNAPLLFPDSIDDAEAKSRGVPVEAVQLEHAKAQNDRALAEIADLQAKIRAAAKSSSERIASLEAENAALKKRVEQLNASVDEMRKRLAIVTPSNDLAGDSAPEITTAKLETMGEKFEGKTVKMTGVRFREADNMWVKDIPGITVASNGLVSRVNVAESEKWIGFNADDSNGRFFQRFYASKKDYGDLLVGLKAGQTINVKGAVVALDNAGWYGLICIKIEVVPATGSVQNKGSDTASTRAPTTTPPLTTERATGKGPDAGTTTAAAGYLATLLRDSRYGKTNRAIALKVGKRVPDGDLAAILAALNGLAERKGISAEELLSQVDAEIKNGKQDDPAGALTALIRKWE